MIETLTTLFVVLSLLAIVLIVFIISLLGGGERPSRGCPNCAGGGRTVAHGPAGLMQVRCPTCNG